MSRPKAILLLLALAIVVSGITFLLPRTPQPLSYHNFADQRSWLGIPDFGNVASNLPLAVVGIWGLIFLLRLTPRELQEHFADSRERWPYILVFIGVLLTAFGSSYYHLAPDNARLVWDRLPMTIVFMSMVAAVIMERISVVAAFFIGGRGGKCSAVASERSGRSRRPPLLCCCSILFGGGLTFDAVSAREIYADLRFCGDCRFLFSGKDTGDCR